MSQINEQQGCDSNAQVKAQSSTSSECTECETFCHTQESTGHGDDMPKWQLDFYQECADKAGMELKDWLACEPF